MSTSEPRSFLFLETRGIRVPVARVPFTLGSDSACDFQIEEDGAISELHAEIAHGEDDSFVILDAGSRTGVLVNGERIKAHRELSHGDTVKIGGAEFRVEFEQAPVTGTVASTRRVPGGRASGRKWLVGAGVAVAVLLGIGLLVQEESDSPREVSEVVEGARPSTVLVKAYDGDEPYGTGSGWIFDAGDGLVVTNSHVLIGGNRFEVSLEDEADLRDAEVVAVSECDDVAVLGTDDSDDLESFPLVPEDSLPRQGDEVVALGFPDNASSEAVLQVTTGTVSALNINWDRPAEQNIDFAVYPDVHQIDAAINPGNSGGPLMNMSGELIGMNSTRGEGDNQGFAISIDRLREVLPGLTGGESLGWGGFTFTALPAGTLNDLAAEIGWAGGWPDSALLVESVIPGSAAEDAGMRPLDTIYRINGTPVNSRSDYCREVGDASGDPVDLEYYSADSGWSESVTTTVRFE